VSLTSSLTADVTLNPDFAQTEADAQQINLSRFSLFFPEKRQFFIEGSDSFRLRVEGPHFGPPPLEVFYSRRIGLSDAGEPIPLVGGGKVTGKAAGFDVGLLNVQSGRHSNGEGENFSVARVRKEVLGRSYVGAIFTNRQGDGRVNRVAAADARFVFMKYLYVAGMMAKSSDSEGGGKAGPPTQQPRVGARNWVRQAALEWRADKLEAAMNYIGIDPGFNPGIGFVRRSDRLFGQRVSFRPRPGGTLVRQLEFNPTNVGYYDDAAELSPVVGPGGHPPFVPSIQAHRHGHGTDIERARQTLRDVSDIDFESIAALERRGDLHLAVAAQQDAGVVVIADICGVELQLTDQRSTRTWTE